MSDEQRQALEMLERSRAAFVAAVNAIPAEHWHRRPSFGGWTPAEIVEHMVLADGSTASYLSGRIFAAPAPEEILARTAGRDAKIIAWLEGEEKAVAPDFVVPESAARDREEALADWMARRDAVAAAFRDGPPDLRRYTGKHPLLGTLDGYQWALQVSMHADRHGRQLGRIAADLAG